MRVFSTLLLLCLCVPAVCSAPPPDAAVQFVRSRATLSGPALSAASLPAAERDPAGFDGRVFDVTASVGGTVAVGGTQTVLLSAGGTAVAARLPDNGRLNWLAAGESVRVLLRMDGAGTDAGLRVLDAAPAGDVAAREQSAQTRGASRSSYPSRGTGYVRSSTPVSFPTYSAVNVPGLSARAQAVYAAYHDAVRRLGRSLSDAQVDTITFSILRFSDLYDLDPRLVVATIIAESGFDMGSTSRTGAAGLGQLMPDTARGLGVTDPYDPVQNIAASVHLLRGHLDSYGGAPAGAGVIPLSKIALCMAAYNAGPGAVKKYHGVPPYRETQRYVAKVAALYKQMLSPAEREALK